MKTLGNILRSLSQSAVFSQTWFQFNEGKPHWNILNLDDSFLDKEANKFISANDIMRFCTVSLFPSFSKAKVFTKPGTVSIVCGDVTNEQIAEFLQPNIGETIIKIPNHWKMAHLVKAFGMFDSVSNATKNGWKGKEIPVGFSEQSIKVGNAKVSVFVFKTA